MLKKVVTSLCHKRLTHASRKIRKPHLFKYTNSLNEILNIDEMVLHKTCATSSFSASDVKVNLEPRNVNANTNRAARRSLGGKNSERFSLSSSQMVYRLWHIDGGLTSLAYNPIIEIYK